MRYHYRNVPVGGETTMAAKKESKKTVQPKEIKTARGPEDLLPMAATPTQAPLPPELERKLKKLKEKLDDFKTKVLEKFGDYITGIAILPPEKPMPKPGEKEDEKAKEDEKVTLLVVVDDTTSTKMTKDELYNKFSTIIKKIVMGNTVLPFLLFV